MGSANLKLNENLNFGLNFSIDQSYNNFNYTELNTNYNFDPMKIGFNYILENKHIGDQEYFKTKIDYTKNSNLFTFETKRNLVSDLRVL